MVNRIISEFLGPFVIILQFFQTRTGWIAVIFGSYLLTYALGLYQLRKIREKTHHMIEEIYLGWKTSDPGLSRKILFERFIPLWEIELSKMRYLYIMNKHDLWPVRINRENVLIKIPLTPEYIEEHLIVSQNRDSGLKVGAIKE